MDTNNSLFKTMLDKLSVKVTQPFKNAFEKLILTQFYGYQKLVPSI
jgi:hypothetical protein